MKPLLAPGGLGVHGFTSMVTAILICPDEGSLNLNCFSYAFNTFDKAVRGELASVFQAWPLMPTL